MGPIVREVKITYKTRKATKKEQEAGYLSLVNKPDLAAEFARSIADEGRECFMVLFLNTRNRLIARQYHDPGTIAQRAIYAREVFRAAVAMDASGVILAHNHPAGTNTPSPEDIEVTQHLKKAGGILGVSVLDHIIVTRDLETGVFKYCSMAEEGVL